MNEDDRRELWAVFVGEAADGISALGRSLLDLETGDAGAGRAERLREIFRHAHTLKGASSVVGREDLAQIAHALETCLDLVRKGTLQPGKVLIDACLKSLDLLQAGLTRELAADEVQRACAMLNEAQQKGVVAS